MPHVGTHVPPQLAARLTDEARQVPDTDWHLERLYDFADALGASVLVATHSRYVIDLNRPPDGASLYPGQSVTGLCPVDSFDDTPLYPAGDLPGRGRDRGAPRSHLAALPPPAGRRAGAHQGAARHRRVVGRALDPLGAAALLRGQAARPEPRHAPRAPAAIRRWPSACSASPRAATGFTSVLNGRFTGGYITRHHGQPAQGVHAVQLEMTQCSYMQEALPFDYLPERAERVQPHLRRMLEAVLDFVEARRG